VCSLSNGKINTDLFSVELCAVHLVPGLLGVVKVVEVNEGKASATSRMTVQHNLHPVQPTKPAELFLQLPFSRVQTQTKNSNAL